jgi:hypothetical protein
MLPASFKVEFLDPDLYRQRPVTRGVCWGCQMPFDLCLTSFFARQKMVRSQGHCSKEDSSVAVPLHSHLQDLCLAIGKAPKELLLCMDCTVRYIKERQRQRTLKEIDSARSPMKKKTRKRK